MFSLLHIINKFNDDLASQRIIYRYFSLNVNTLYTIYIYTDFTFNFHSIFRRNSFRKYNIIVPFQESRIDVILSPLSKNFDTNETKEIETKHTRRSERDQNINILRRDNRAESKETYAVPVRPRERINVIERETRDACE